MCKNSSDFLFENRYPQVYLQLFGLAITRNMHSATKQKEKNKKNKALKLLILGSCTNHYSSVPWFPQTKNSLLIKYL